jgi:hypothetical protein
MKYLCIHGYVFMSCDICSEETEMLQSMELEQNADDSYTEYLYDHYLDLDERLLREQEEI